MGVLDEVVLEAIRKKNMEEHLNANLEKCLPTVNVDSNEEEILDFILLYLCTHLSRFKNYYKGGYILMKILPELARYSYDIDFSIENGEQYEIIKDVLNNLGNTLVELGVCDSFTIKPNITPTSSGGVKFHREGKKELGIDIGWHDISYGMCNWRFQGYDLFRFSVERMLSDKLSAIYSPKRFRRAKDLYDVYILYKSFDINYESLLDYIEKRNTIDWSKDPFREEVAIQYAYAYDKLDINSNRENKIEKISFSECMSVLRVIVDRLESLKNGR